MIDVFSFTDATIQFLVPGEEFQELNPVNAEGGCNNPPCKAAARVKGKVLLGLGCYCKVPKAAVDINCAYTVAPLSNRRHLQAGDVATATVEFIAPMEVTMAVVEKAGCTGFFLFCWFEAFVAFLLSILTFGLL